MRLVISLGPMADKKIFTRLLYIYTPAAFLFPTLPVWFMEVGVGYFKQREHPFSFGAIELSLTVTLLKKVLYYEHLGLLTLSSLFIFVANGIEVGRSKKVEINDHARKRLQKLFYLSTFAITIPHLFRIILKTNSMDEKPKIKLRPTEGVVDYATEYKKAITDKNQLINSAKYFLKMRTSHLTEVLGTWEDIVDDMDLEIAELVLNEFLSPKCTLLEFEFKNLTVAGRKIAATIPEEGTPEKAFSEVWQQHILGKVLTNENVSTVSIPEIETTQAGDKTDVTKKAETTSAEKEGKSDKDNEKKEVKEEVDEKKDGLTDSDDNKEAKTVNAEVFTKIYLIYKRIRWFSRNIAIEKLKVEKDKKQEIAMGILVFDRAFSITWKVVNCLVYMEILENVRKDWAGPVATVFGRVHKMLVEENMGIFTEDSADLLKCAHLFILRYRGELDEDLLFRLGFGYLSKKLHILKRDNTNAMAILNVASHMADQELKITEVHKLLEEVFNFDILQL
ncbi:hypothetical protein L5515_017821 [Caenorhabditis briggsae]|uniref:Uncharacterized protein n=3 Tax=Caenorhabditis briggsae TaxID=6238 RepID=A0AAE9FHT0_CAEBR|nr:hypothetical protein L5515_017821 [Caenorhabditis briggsae]